MGCSIRLFAYLVRCGMFLVLAGMGGFGCSTFPWDGPSPSPAAPVLTQSCYRAPDSPAEKGSPDSLGMPAVLPPAAARPLQILTLSGGVAGAPFTAGVLVGWTKSGTRPIFDQVTGISSGSLVGCYAFLGPKYDALMQKLILTLKTDNLIKFRPLYCMLCEGAFGSGRPANELIHRAFDDGFMDDLRQAYAEGRRLYIGTMNLETRRLAVWDVGAMASSGRPDAYELVRKVLLAAVSWPGAVPPVAFDVEINGHCHREEHCDAGAVAMVLPPFAPLTGCLAGSDIYVLASRKLYSEPACVRKSAFCRLKPCMMAFFEALTRENIGKVYSVCMLTGARFHLLALPQEFHGEPPSLTNIYPKEAPMLFETGYQLGVRGPCWRFTPPGAEPGEEAIPHDGRGIQFCH